ncbi:MULTISPECIES: hypothetical protein [Amycolatopsis]|uniref:Uncharacterized protein n=1 Tax=Amycolatopsis albidoflavus TaxID=102226 RepID=A0ABW5HS50_9PSEU
MDPATLNHREYAILCAVAEGRAEMLVGCEPGLTVDGGWCDRAAVSVLVAEQWIAPVRPAPVGERVPAQLTGPARDALDRCRPKTA